MPKSQGSRFRLPDLWRGLTEPSALIEGAEIRRRARLLSALLVAILALALIAIALTVAEISLDPERENADAIRVPLRAGGLVAFAYALSRTRFYAFAAALTAFTFFISTFAAYTYNPTHPLTLGFLIAGGLISSLFLSTRATTLVFLATMAAIGLLPLLVPAIDTATVLTAVFLTFSLGILIVIATAMHQRDLDKISQQAQTLAEREGRLSDALSAADGANARLLQSVDALERLNREAALLAEMSGLLNLCAEVAETYAVIQNSAAQLFPHESGALYMYTESRQELHPMAIWGSLKQAGDPLGFGPADCWALRRGRIHQISPEIQNVSCRHLPTPIPARSLCVPMVSQGDALGVFHVRSGIGVEGNVINEGLAKSVAEQIALTLTSLKLRETLRDQSIRDPLTGLFNRRYMRETLERELHRAIRSHVPMAVVMLDLDHFKRFNDTFGHEAGDLVLRELGALLQTHVRTSDVACRYGGEEFTLLMMDAPIAIIKQRLEMLRASLRSLNLRDRGRALGVVTISAGVAAYPQNGKSPDDLLRAADQALYRAKAEGRDRVVASEPSPETPSANFTVD